MKNRRWGNNSKTINRAVESVVVTRKVLSGHPPSIWVWIIPYHPLNPEEKQLYFESFHESLPTTHDCRWLLNETYSFISAFIVTVPSSQCDIKPRRYSQWNLYAVSGHDITDDGFRRLNKEETHELNMRGLTAARDATAKSFVTIDRGWESKKRRNNNRISSRSSGGGGGSWSTARPGCAAPATTIPQAGVTHFIRSIYIRNAAQGDEHDNPPSIEN